MRDVPAGHPWHGEVGEDDVERLLLHARDRLGAVGEDHHAVTARLEHVAEHRRHRALVVHDEAAKAVDRRRLRGGGRRRGDERLGAREHDPERRATTLLAVDGDAGPVAGEDAIRHRQTEAGALRPLRREEGVEDLLLHGDRNAHAGVGDRQLDALAHDRGAELDRASLRHRVDGIQDEIGQRFAQLGRVAGHGRQRGRRHASVDDEPLAKRVFPPSRLGHLERVPDDRVQVDGAEWLIPAHPRELLEPPDGLGPVERGSLDDLQPARQLGVLHVALEELRPAQDRREHVVEVVGHAGGHLAQRAELLGAHELVLGRRQLAVGAPALVEEPRAAELQRRELADVGEQALIGCRERALGAPEHDQAEARVAGSHRYPEPEAQRRASRQRLHAVTRALGRVIVGA